MCIRSAQTGSLQCGGAISPYEPLSGVKVLNRSIKIDIVLHFYMSYWQAFIAFVIN